MIISSHKVLIVDDSLLERKIVIRMLNKIGVDNITIATNGLEAVDVYTLNYNNYTPFTIVFMDMEMPIMNGIIATENIIKLNPTAKIYGITSNDSPEEIKRFLNSGIQQVFIKPIHYNYILDILSTNT